MQKVTLSGPHTHKGKPVTAGETIECSAGEAKWLERRGLIAAPTVPLAMPLAVKKTKQENDDHGTA